MRPSPTDEGGIGTYRVVSRDSVQVTTHCAVSRSPVPASLSQLWQGVRKGESELVYALIKRVALARGLLPSEGAFAKPPRSLRLLHPNELAFGS